MCSCSISVESKKGEGSAFTVYISLKNSAHQGPATHYVKPEDMRVLIVDDEEIAAEHARLVLDEVGIKADTCLSGEDALHMLEVQHAKHKSLQSGPAGLENAGDGRAGGRPGDPQAPR